MLVRLKPKPGEKKAVWLLIKEKDAAAAPGRDILAERPESVKSGRRIEELAPAAPVKVGRLRPGALAGAVKGPGPERLTPQLASPVERPPEGGDWLHEIKLDGYRTLAFRDGEAVRLITRGGLDWTHRYGDLAEAFRALPCREAVVDGEIVVQDEGGVSRFALLQDALSRGARNELVFFAFDLVRLDGWNLAGVPLVEAEGVAAAAAGGGDGAVGDPVLRPCGGGRGGVLRAGVADGAGGGGLEAGLGGLSPGAVEDLGEVQGEALRGLRDRGIHGVGGGGRVGRAGARGVGGRGARLSREGGHGVRCRDARRSAGAAEAAWRTGSWRSRGRRRMSAGCGRSCRSRWSIPT